GHPYDLPPYPSWPSPAPVKTRNSFSSKAVTPKEMDRHRQTSRSFDRLHTTGGSRPAGLELYQEIIGGMLRALLNLSRITPAVVYH
ncbi:MAG: hypothetical protein WAW39_23390, partial [Prosthecobacter sp.]|uniref:hypothetical protein n=1 Tax=Prosthecobacter sp. TaxID=1965333 RepID=UPI003BAF90AA